MRSVFFLALSAVATLVAARDNAFNIPREGYEFSAGKPTKLSWDPSTEGTVTLKLQWGGAFDSSTGTTIASSIPNSGSYTWDVPASITDRSDYTIEIISDEDPNASNYLPRFTVEGAVAATTTTSTETTTTETSSTRTPTSTTTTTSTTTESPTPSPTSTTSTTTSSTTTSTETSTESPTETPTDVPNVNDDDDNAGMTNRVSGSMLALALGVVALI